MTTDVEICKLALSNIRAGSLNSLDDATLPAQMCKLKYPILRDFLLGQLTWGFARSIKALAVVTTEVFTWSQIYSYPSDCLKMLRLVGPQEELANASTSLLQRLFDEQVLPAGSLRNKIPHEIFTIDGNKLIGTNDEDLRIDYTVKITDPTLFSMEFVMALSHLLSSELAIPLVGVKDGRSLRSDSLQIYNQYLLDAMSSDANEDYLEQEESEFIAVRR